MKGCINSIFLKMHLKLIKENLLVLMEFQTQEIILLQNTITIGF